jgi:cytochrome c peroxidase
VLGDLGMAKFIISISFLLGISSLLVSFIKKNEDASSVETLKKLYQRPQYVRYPKSNPYTPAKEILGKALFFEEALSRSNKMSCATCHRPDYHFTDNYPKALGREGAELPRRTPTLLNVAFGNEFFWDGRARTLEEQALMPIQAHDEMDLSLDEMVNRLSQDPNYQKLFKVAFPQEGLTPASVAKAITTYERSIISINTPFDRWIDGEERAISEEAKKGFVLFNEKAKCVTCHSGWNFTNGSYADTGLAETQPGRGEIVQLEVLKYGFKTPTLRSVADRAPYMHDGSLSTLNEVVEHYNRGGSHIRKSTKIFITSLNLTESEKSQLIDFLMTLSRSKKERHIASQESHRFGVNYDH